MAFKKLKLWFDKDLAIRLADQIVDIDILFSKSKFLEDVDNQLDTLELKGRVECLADRLSNCLSGEYPEQLATLMQILGPENEEETGMFKKYYWVMPIAKFVEKYGLNHFNISMKAIEEITKRNTGEYTIRPYLEKYPNKTLNRMKKWALNKNKHIRRLASEGVRPRLPWAKKMDNFITDPTLILPILERLKDDDSKYVQKSVANCINDILKDNESIGKQLLTDWSVDASASRKWIIRHSLRNLRKSNVSWALELSN